MLIGEPLALAALHTMVIEVPSEKPEGFPGASGSDAGVKLVEAVEKEPVPCSEIAATRNMYAVPFVKPRTVVAVVGEVPSTNVIQVAPLSALY